MRWNQRHSDARRSRAKSGGGDAAVERRHGIAVSAGLAMITFVTFAGSLSNGFIDTYDDKSYVLENVNIQDGLTLSSLRYALTGVCVSNWHPLTMLSHILDVQFFGLNAWGHHLTSLLLHMANTVLLYWVLRAMTGANWRSAIVAVLFAIHPLHVQSVAMVAQRKDVLSTFFMLLAILEYGRHATSNKSRMGRTTLWLSFSLLSKPMAVTLPVLLLLLDIWPLRRLGPDLKNPRQVALQIWDLTREKWPLFAVSAIMSVVVFLVQRSTGATASFADFPLALRFVNALCAYVAYIRLTILPKDLAAFYPYAKDYPIWLTLGSSIFLSMVTVFCIWQLRSRPHLFLGWGWYLISLLPVIGIIQVGVQSMADRYTYVPLIGLFIAVVWGIHEVCQPRQWSRIAATTFAVSAMVAYVPVSWTQVGYWSDTETLWRHDLAITENNYLANANLHMFYVLNGQFDKALEYGAEALEIMSTPDLVVGMALVNKIVQRPQDAERILLDAKKTHPEFYRFSFELARLYIAQDRFDAAEKELAQMASRSAEIEVGVASAYAEKNEMGRAAAHFKKAIELDPGQPEGYLGLGQIAEISGSTQQAIDAYTQAYRINSEIPGIADRIEYLKQLNSRGGAAPK